MYLVASLLLVGALCTFRAQHYRVFHWLLGVVPEVLIAQLLHTPSLTTSYRATLSVQDKRLYTRKLIYISSNTVKTSIIQKKGKSYPTLLDGGRENR